VTDWLDALGVWGLRSHEKRAPEKLFEQPEATIGRFLRHLWSTDGCIRPPRYGVVHPAVYYATSSPKLAVDVQSLLLRLGVHARVEIHPQGSKGRDQYHVKISGRSQLLRFGSLVGAAGQYKTTCLEEVLASLECRTENTNRDVIPKEVWDLYVRPAMSHNGITQRELQRDIDLSCCGHTLYKQNLGRERALRVARAARSEELELLAGSDVYWDRIVSIVRDGIEEVFDLTVPGPHNFIANDLFVHNSIEQDADIVAFIYRDEIYNPENEDAQGTAELIVAKNRNGQTGTVDLAFFGETTTFRSLSRQAPPPP
jgi:replicative DNA helicase